MLACKERPNACPVLSDMDTWRHRSGMSSPSNGHNEHRERLSGEECALEQVEGLLPAHAPLSNDFVNLEDVQLLLTLPQLTNLSLHPVETFHPSTNDDIPRAKHPARPTGGE